MNWSADFIREEYGFDAVGVMKLESKVIIILALQTRQERDLDEFIGGHEELNNWCFSGFKKYFSPKVDNFLEDFEKADPKAKPIAGYSNLYKIKELAIRSGIGIQGRNTLIINDSFQSQLRFVVVETFLDIETTGDGL